MKRRSFIRHLVSIPVLGTLLKSAAALADWNVEAFTAETESDALAIFFPGRAVSASDAISIGVHELVENGAVVPVQIESSLPDVQSITILVEKNPNPLIAHFDLAPECNAFVATRIKVGAPSDIVAVVQSGGKLFSRRQFVEVIEGGCG